MGTNEWNYYVITKMSASITLSINGNSILSTSGTAGLSLVTSPNNIMILPIPGVYYIDIAIMSGSTYPY